MSPELPPVLATKTEPQVSLGSGPTMVLPSMIPQPGVEQAYIVGTDDRPTDNRPVAIAINVRVDVKTGDREFSTSVGLHEALVLRGYLEGIGGSCTLRMNGSWPPGLSRHRTLTQSKLNDEMLRLSTKQIPRKDMAPLDCFGQYFPGNASERLVRLHKVMGDQYVAWRRIEAQALVRLQANPPVGLAGMRPGLVASLASEFITEKEVLDVAQMVDPTGQRLETVHLAEVSLSPPPLASGAPLGVPLGAALEEIIKTAELATDPVGDRVHEAFARLREAGFSDAVAVAASALLERAESGDKLSDEAIISAIGSKAKLGAARNALRG